MPPKELRERADRRFEQALRESGARDPRDYYRERLKELKERDADAYRRAVGYFEERLTPTVAEDGSDPLTAWMEYGRFLAELSAPGRTVQIDSTGRASSFAPPVRPDHLVVHLPTAPAERALLVGLPRELSPAQRATYELLVKGSQG